MIYDAIVIGTGPAGSTAAFELARRGYRVLALEKKRHPRYKVCGGGLSVRLDNLLGRHYHTVVERTVTRLVITCNGESSFEVSFDAPLAYMTMRSRFDDHLICQAQEAGCDLRENEPAVEFNALEDSVLVRTPLGEYEGRTVIGADGAPSRVAKTLFPKNAIPLGVALESESAAAPGRSWPDDGLLIDVGIIRGGYAWIFPKSDHLSSGVATFRRGRQDPRLLYGQWGQGQPTLPPLEQQKIIGHLIPRFSPKAESLAGRRALLIGDAAGMVDPFLGEGIYYAVWSGRLAAEAVAGFLKEKTPLARYEEAVRNEIYPELWAASRIAGIVYRFPRLVFKLASRNPRWLAGYGKVLQGRRSYQELWRRGLDPRRWFK
ncbi:MAG: geranylgeranyl reductase family protein [Nitrospirae bacterium]|nr:geranylgeranyl reductase family protein [Nitrospirota bacterium]